MNEQISGVNISAALLSSLLVNLWIDTCVTLALWGLGLPIFEMDHLMEPALPTPVFIAACWTDSGHSKRQASPQPCAHPDSDEPNNFCGGNKALK